MDSDDVSDYVMIHSEDIYFLLAVIAQAEVLAEFVKHAESKGSAPAKRAMNVWRDLLINEA